MALVEVIEERESRGPVTDALVQSVNALLKIALAYGRPLPGDVLKMIDRIENPGRLADLVAVYLNLELEGPTAFFWKSSIRGAAERSLSASDQRGAETPGARGNPVRGGQAARADPEGIPAAGADEADPGGTRRRRPAAGRAQRSADAKSRRAGCPTRSKAVAEKELSRLERINPSSPEYTVCPHLPGIPLHRPLAEGDRRSARHQPRPADSR